MIIYHGKLKEYREFIIGDCIDGIVTYGLLLSIESKRERLSAKAFDITVKLYNNIELNEDEILFLTKYHLEYTPDVLPQNTITDTLYQISLESFNESHEVYSKAYNWHDKDLIMECIYYADNIRDYQRKIRNNDVNVDFQIESGNLEIYPDHKYKESSLKRTLKKIKRRFVNLH